MEKEQECKYAKILNQELVEATGCTEPIAISYVASIAGKVSGKLPTEVIVSCSGNVIKNVKGVTVPNSGGKRGIEMAALLGIVGGNSDKGLSVLEDINEQQRQQATKLYQQGICKVQLKQNVPNLYIDVIVKDNEDEVEVELQNSHQNITLVRHNKEIIKKVDQEKKNEEEHPDLTIKGIIDYAENTDLKDVKDALERQIKDNCSIAKEGIDSSYGQQVGRTLLETYGDKSVNVRCRAYAAAGSDARMSGCPKPVVINSGSGNQGITVTMPVIEYAENLKVDHETLLRALIISNLVSIHIKSYIGSLSAFCGATSAAAGAGAAICWLLGGNYEQIGASITNTLGTISGMVCDGAKSSCAGKISSAVETALLSVSMAMKDRSYQEGEGLVSSDPEETIKAYGKMAKEGMKGTDIEIIQMMIEK